MENKEKELTPQESVEVMQRMVRQAEATAHFTGRPFLWAGVSFIITFLTMALLYALWPGRNWTWVFFLYTVLNFIFWYRSLPKKGSPQTLAERIIGEVWRTGEAMIFGTVLYGCIDVEKSFKGKRPCTRCRITPTGLKAFDAYIEALKSYLTI